MTFRTCALALVLLLEGVRPSLSLSAADSDKLGLTPSSHVVIIPQDSVHPFWADVHAGADKAAAELAAAGVHVEIEWAAPARENDVSAQIQSVVSATARKANGIILAPLDRKELAGPVAAAVASGISVTALDAGVDTRPPAAFVGSDNYEAGRMAGQRLGELLEGKGNVILFRHHIHAEDAEEREEGFLQVIQTEFPGIRLLVTDFHTGPTDAIAKRVAASLIGRYEGILNGAFSSSERSGAFVLAELRTRNLARGKVKFVGIEDEGGILRPAVASGDVQGLVAQDPSAMGYLAVKNLVARLRGENPPTVVNTALTLLAPPGSAVTGAPETFDPKAAVSAGRGTIVVPDLGLVLVAIPAGKFAMGSAPQDRAFRDTDSPQTQVTISRPFWIGKYDVTQAEWNRIMPVNPSDFVGDLNPVDNVDWIDVAAFCDKLNDRERKAGRLPEGYHYSLPTEAEWEYACRAGTTGPRAGDLDQMGWYVGNSGSWSHPEGPESRPKAEVWRMSTHPVGQKKPNAWGLYDMYGNVLEWCLDWYGPYAGKPVTDPMGPATSPARILRGGGWWTDPEVCYSYSRTKAPPTRHHNAMGFRLALRPDSP